MYSQDATSQGTVSFGLQWSGNPELRGHLKGWKVGLIQITFPGSKAEVSARVDETALPARVQKLQMTIQENTGRPILDTISRRVAYIFSCPVEMAASMQMQVTITKEYVNRSMGFMGSDGRISYEKRALGDHLTVPMEDAPDFEDGGMYAIHVAPDAEGSVRAALKPCALETEITGNEGVHYMDLLGQWCKTFQERAQILERDSHPAHQASLKAVGEQVTQEMMSLWMETYSLEDLDRLLAEAEEADLSAIPYLNYSLQHPLCMQVLSAVHTTVSRMEAVAPAIEAYQNTGFERALEVLEELDNAGARYFGYLCIANLCTEAKNFLQAESALSKVPSGTEGKDDQVLKLQREKRIWSNPRTRALWETLSKPLFPIKEVPEPERGALNSPASEFAEKVEDTASSSASEDSYYESSDSEKEVADLTASIDQMGLRETRDSLDLPRESGFAKRDEKACVLS